MARVSHTSTSGPARGAKNWTAPAISSSPEYWYLGWHKKLSLAGKVMLLIALYQGDGFPLSYEQTPRYYGISSASAQRGLRELVDAGLLHREQHRRPEPESPYGFADVYYYEALEPPLWPTGWAAKWAHSGWRGPEAPDGKERQSEEREGNRHEKAQTAEGERRVSRDKLDSCALELAIAGAAVLLSTLGLLFGSHTLTVVALVAGAISFGILIGTRAIALPTTDAHCLEDRDRPSSSA